MQPMPILAWMYDLAREQSPSHDALTVMMQRSLAAGYNAVGLYLEHRFAYPSVPWPPPSGSLTPAGVTRLQEHFLPAGLRIVPFLNTLGHLEGFIRAQGGQRLSEGRSTGSAQICPTRSECVAFAHGLVNDAIDCFRDEWIHLGGDETRQLGQCPACAARVASVGKAGLYGEHYAALCKLVLDRGRRPCLWGDMLLEHPEALPHIPRQTLIFDWQYFNRPRDSTRRFRQAGFDVVCCPSVQTYNSGWCYLDATQSNIDEHAEDAAALGALGVLVTSWEFSYFTAYDTALPLIYAAGRRLSRGESWEAALRAEGGATYARLAAILGREIPAAAEFLKPGTWRQLRDRFVIRQNPFYLWQDWRAEACGPAGDRVLALCDRAALGLADDDPWQLPITLHRVAVGWVRLAESAAQRYADGQPAAAASVLEHGRELLESLRPPLRRAALSGGSCADAARLDRLAEKIATVCVRLRALSGVVWLPAFETLIHDAYVAGDEAAWRTAKD
ncbi:Glycosyl hydrolase family 20, catalytic domain [Phycisphaerae bacterium RAS1]|nr:Glycosyl hydrolase family 20, catalytic domain [Phycisphaerae bacterium RAS1]